MYKGTVGLFVLKADNYSSTEWTWHFTDWCFWRGWTRTECAWREEKKWQKMTKGGEWKDRLGFVFKVVLLKLKWHFGEMCTFQKPCGSARGIPSHATLISALTLYFDTKHTRQRRAALVAHTQCTLPKLIPNHFFITGTVWMHVYFVPCALCSLVSMHSLCQGLAHVFSPVSVRLWITGKWCDCILDSGIYGRTAWEYCIFWILTFTYNSS